MLNALAETQATAHLLHVTTCDRLLAGVVSREHIFSRDGRAVNFGRRGRKSGSVPTARVEPAAVPTEHRNRDAGAVTAGAGVACGEPLRALAVLGEVPGRGHGDVEPQGQGRRRQLMIEWFLLGGSVLLLFCASVFFYNARVRQRGGNNSWLDAGSSDIAACGNDVVDSSRSRWLYHLAAKFRSLVCWYSGIFTLPYMRVCSSYCGS